MSQDLVGQLRELEADGRTSIQSAQSQKDLEEVRIQLLGRSSGRLTPILRGLGSLPPEERGAIGAEANRVKQLLSELLEARQAELPITGVGASTLPLPTAEGRGRVAPRGDLSLPGRRRWRGGLHPVTQVIEEVCDIFRDLGFTRVAGPEAETTDYNFTRLNIPLDHPAADMHDTLYLSEHVLLRTHTSPVQARTMERFAPPVRVVVPGKVFRRDPYDASHAPAFEQIEGLAVDEGITFVDFKATISEFVRRFFGPSAKTRFRPSFFPFTEPSAEVDVSCQLCGGAGCSACKGTGWMEIMGSGMVHPNVFRAVGYDPEKYTGYAFGMGPGRIAMLRFGIPDIRLLYESDVRFLEQFG